jgi:tRNA pseudouridine13 synthase
MQDYKLNQNPEDFIVDEIPSIALKESGQYLIFRMKKKNYSTEDAVQHIARSLGTSRKSLGYAGSKDSRAITTQLISIRGATKEHALSLRMKDIELEFLGCLENPISLGDLEGNRFEITIRNITERPRPIERMLNVFGKQRFSKNNPASGKAILKKDFRQAIESICNSSPKDKALIEEHLEKNKNDFVGGLKKLPWKNIQLLVHAYQSKIWNNAAREYALNERPRDATLPIVGFSTYFADDEIAHIYKKILEEEGISLSDFVIRQIPELSSDGGERKLYAEIKDLEIGELAEDELNPGMKKCNVKFSLGKGSYATEAIKEMMN